MSIHWDPVVAANGAGELLQYNGGLTYNVRVAGSQTNNEFSVVEVTIPPGALGAQPHVHRDHSEHFHVISGEITFTVGDEDVVISDDSWVSVARDFPHGFRNDSDQPATYRCIFTPAGYEEIFRTVDEIIRTGREPSADELAELRAKYGTTPA